MDKLIGKILSIPKEILIITLIIGVIVLIVGTLVKKVILTVMMLVIVLLLLGSSVIQTTMSKNLGLKVDNGSIYVVGSEEVKLDKGNIKKVVITETKNKEIDKVSIEYKNIKKKQVITVERKKTKVLEVLLKMYDIEVERK